MDRRTLLVGVAATLSTAVAGCVGDGHTEPPNDEPHSDAPGGDRIVAVTFETRSDAPVDATVEDDPVVEMDDEEGEIRVEGRYAIGDRCHEEVLREATVEEDALVIRLGRVHDGSDECELEDQEVPYRVVVTVDGSLPDVVEVTTVNRSRGGETRVER